MMLKEAKMPSRTSRVSQWSRAALVAALLTASASLISLATVERADAFMMGVGGFGGG